MRRKSTIKNLEKREWREEKMYKISVSVDNSNLSDIGREKTLSEIAPYGFAAFVAKKS